MLTIIGMYRPDNEEPQDDVAQRSSVGSSTSAVESIQSISGHHQEADRGAHRCEICDDVLSELEVWIIS
jgi:hypothetical protein